MITIKNTMNGIADGLKPYIDYVDKEVVQLNGYNNQVLGGGGLFYFDSGSMRDPDDGIIIIPNNISVINPGRWIRINFDEINVKFFGAYGSGNPLQDDTNAIQEAIDYAYKNMPKGGTVYIPQGTYYVQEIILKDGVSIRGEFNATELRPFPESSSPTPIYKNQLITLDEGPVRLVNVSDLSLNGLIDNPKDPGTYIEANMHGIHINSNIGSTLAGGLWEATFKNIRIENFKKTGLRFQGGIDDTNYPNQFILLENIRVIKSSADKESRALYMHGQNGQFSFTNCTFSGSKNENKTGKCVEIQGIADEIVHGQIENRPKCSVINFNTCTFEDGETGVFINTCLEINIWGCWFENLKYAVYSFNTIGADISNNRFSNASNYGIKSTNLADGYIFYTTQSAASYSNNTIRGKYAHNNNTSGSGGTVQIQPNNLNYNGFNNNNRRNITNGNYIFFS